MAILTPLVTCGDDKITVVYVRDLLHEIPTSDVEAAVLAYCGVLSVQRSKCADFPALFDGIRVSSVIFRIFRPLVVLSAVSGTENKPCSAS